MNLQESNHFLGDCETSEDCAVTRNSIPDQDDLKKNEVTWVALEYTVKPRLLPMIFVTEN